MEYNRRRLKTQRVCFAGVCAQSGVHIIIVLLVGCLLFVLFFWLIFFFFFKIYLEKRDEAKTLTQQKIQKSRNTRSFRSIFLTIARWTLGMFRYTVLYFYVKNKILKARNGKTKTVIIKP